MEFAPRSVKGRQTAQVWNHRNSTPTAHRQLDVPHPPRNKQQYLSHRAERLLPQCAQHRQTTLAGLLCLAAGSRHTAAKFLPPSRSAGTFCTFFLQLFQSKSFSSFGRTPIVPVTLKIGLQCFLLRQQLVEFSCILGTSQEETTLYKETMWDKNCSLQPSQPLPYADFKPVLCSGATGLEGELEGRGGICGSPWSTLPAARGSWVALGIIGDGQYVTGGKGWVAGD